MKKRFILISGIAAVATLSVTSLAVARGQTVFADPVAPRNYIATMDSNNQLMVYKNDYFFQLHGGEEYGLFFVDGPSNQEEFSIDPNSDFAFSVTITGEDYFGFTMEDLTLDERSKNGYWDVKVDGKTKTVRGFPGANQVTIVYEVPDGGFPLSRTADSNNTRWNFVSSTHVGNRYTDTYTIKETLPEVSRLDFLFTRPYTEDNKTVAHTYNVYSFTLYYTC